MKSLLVSVNYSDYLACVLPDNVNVFEEIIVVTTKSDTDCQHICDQYKNVTCITVPDELLNLNNSTFNKGVLLNHGMSYLYEHQYQGYLCLTDSDIIFKGLNMNFDQHMQTLESRGVCCKEMLIGMSRYIIKNFNNYCKWKQNPDLKYRFVERLNPGKERTLLGYAQIFHFDCMDEWRDYNDRPIWSQDEHCMNTQQVDTKFIGNFLNRAKASEDWKHKRDDDCEMYKYSRIMYSNQTHGKEYGVHVEDAEMYCLHIGHPWINRNGRTTGGWG